MNMKGFQHLESATQNAYKRNGFPMISGTFSRKVRQKDQGTTCFIRVRIGYFTVCEIQCFPMNTKGFQHLESASRNAYKRNGFPMILGIFVRKVRQNDQETRGFIRVRMCYFTVCEILRFPKEYEGFATPRKCITECL